QWRAEEPGELGGVVDALIRMERFEGMWAFVAVGHCDGATTRRASGDDVGSRVADISKLFRFEVRASACIQEHVRARLSIFRQVAAEDVLEVPVQVRRFE